MPVFHPDDDYLVLTRYFSDSYSRHEGGHLDHTTIRRRVFAALNGSVVVGSGKCSTGLYEDRLIHTATGRFYRVRLTWGTARGVGGGPRLAPDGVKRMVYATDLTPVDPEPKGTP